MPCVWFGAITIDGLICFEVGPNLASVFCWCCVISIFVLLVNVCSCCVMFSFFSTKSKDWLGIMSSGWCLLCVVGRKTLSQCSVSHRASTSSCWHYAFGAMCIAVYKAVCCHSNVTHAPIANPPSSAQLEDTRYHSPKLHPGPCSSVRMWWGQTDSHTAVTNIHYTSSMPHSKCC